MAAYVIVRVTAVLDEARVADYRAKAPATIEAHGGRVLVGGNPVRHFEGPPEDARIVIIEFPDRAAAEAWWDSPAYQAIAAARAGALEMQVYLVDGA